MYVGVKNKNYNIKLEKLHSIEEKKKKDDFEY